MKFSGSLRACFAALAALTLLCTVLCGCITFKTDEQLILERIQTFETKYNQGDYEGMLGCFDTTTRNAYGAMGRLAGSLGGQLISNELGFDLGLDMGDMFSLGAYFSGGDLINISVGEVEITGEGTAKVPGTMRLNNPYQEGEAEDQSVTFIMVKEGSDWFIKDIKY